MNETGLYRCRICGEVYFGTHPSHCPFCGAHQGNLIPIAAWHDENEGTKVSDQDRHKLETTQKLEYDNTRLYRAAAAEASTPELSGYFKYLAKIENEHYNVVTKLLGTPKDGTIFEPSKGMGSDIDNLKKSEQLEDHASKLYANFAESTVEPRLKKVFQALSEVEADHIVLDEAELSKLK